MFNRNLLRGSTWQSSIPRYPTPARPSPCRNAHARQPATTPNEFTDALTCLGWKQADFCRKTDTYKNTPSRWTRGHTSIPGWVPHYLTMALEIRRLAALVEPPKA
ncbi:hypothetical protein [Paraburkholderia oxyphila]|uniref:hypothetical protein n=1 Tax=Paraburkholderia oxyphila TaxID=614212 RepID=UPI000487E271|nr:hypothetical protein [Paraburkholderia oxyphila]